HPPVPLVLGAVDERLPPVGPPQPFQRPDHEVPSQLPLAGELDRVGDGVQRLDDTGVVLAGVRVAVPVGGEEPLGGDLDQLPVGVGRRVALPEVPLDVVLRAGAGQRFPRICGGGPVVCQLTATRNSPPLAVRTSTSPSSVPGITARGWASWPSSSRAGSATRVTSSPFSGTRHRPPS